MSIFSFKSYSNSSISPSSILKKSSTLKVKLNQINNTPNKVRFVLPHSKKVHNILHDYVKNNYSKEYENLLCLIRDSELLDDDVSSLLKEATNCISLMNENLRIFVDALFSINWIDRSETVVKEYQTFIVNLISAHNYHAKYVVDKLVSLFIPDINDPAWPDGIPTDVDCAKCANIHSLLNVLLHIVPMCKELLMQSLLKHFPFRTKSVHFHEYYVHNLLWILDYQPTFRRDLLHLIISKLVELDANAPREEILKDDNMEDIEMFQMDIVKPIDTMAETLDVCLDKLYSYFINVCHDSNSGVLNWEKTKLLYHDILIVFDKVILPTYNIHHVQFIMFFLCCFKSTIAEGFLNYLWKKVCNPNVAAVLRQTSVNYIASLIARATYASLSMLKGTLQQMAEWIHCYISTQDGLESVNSDVRVHTVFYSICQSMFYIISFRYRELVANKKNMVFLESLNVAKIITCRLNPLRVCQPAVVQNFAVITRQYQLAYCYSVMEHNARNGLPTIYQNERGSELISNNILQAFFPFDPYVLERSGKKINPFYREYVEEYDDNGMNKEDDLQEGFEMDDDFVDQQSPPSCGSKSSYRKFSYSSSPGFKYKY